MHRFLYKSLGYIEPGLSALNTLVKHLFIIMEGRGITNRALAQATCIPIKTIESWNGRNPTRTPNLQDLLACYQELNCPLVPSTYEQDRAFRNSTAEALLALRHRHR